ncbi:MAG: hypothetical protein IH908_13665, partial [Proteobacteria bacterium]|nr:hypothetical protein [Pseudomonadota bacterium]
MSKRKPRPHIYSPRVWGTWLAVGFAWLLTHLPLRVMVALSKGFGRVFYHLAHHRRHVAEINLKLCFPELSDEARKQMVKNVFIHVAVGAAVTALGELRGARVILVLVPELMRERLDIRDAGVHGIRVIRR